MSDEKLSPGRRLLIGAVALVMAGSGFAAGRVFLRPSERVSQPIEFNHLLHVEDVELECETCHEYYASGQHSGLPSLEICSICHAEAVTESAEEARLLQLIAEDPDTTFSKLFRMPDHVYYSHRRHVTVAGIECESCHGDIAQTTAPPPTPLMRITMDGCIECHIERGAKTDCTYCHR